MAEDVTAKRNRDSLVGPAVIVALVGLLILLMAVYVLRPGRPATPPDPEVAIQPLEARVAADQAADRSRQSQARETPSDLRP